MTGRLSDAEVRERVRRIGDRYLLALAEVLRRRTDRDGGWEVPGDLDQYGDGSGLAAILDQQIIGPVLAATEQAAGELAELREAVEADKRRRFGPGYRPSGSEEM